ncbi:MULTISPECIES: hypothetical protein [unclassified Blautia]
MAKAYHEALHPLGNLGIQVSMQHLKAPICPCTGMKLWRSYSA